MWKLPVHWIKSSMCKHDLCNIEPGDMGVGGGGGGGSWFWEKWESSEWKQQCFLSPMHFPHVLVRYYTSHIPFVYDWISKSHIVGILYWIIYNHWSNGSMIYIFHPNLVGFVYWIVCSLYIELIDDLYLKVLQYFSVWYRLTDLGSIKLNSPPTPAPVSARWDSHATDLTNVRDVFFFFLV